MIPSQLQQKVRVHRGVSFKTNLKVSVVDNTVVTGNTKRKTFGIFPLDYYVNQVNIPNHMCHASFRLNSDSYRLERLIIISLGLKDTYFRDTLEFNNRVLQCVLKQVECSLHLRS